MCAIAGIYGESSLQSLKNMLKIMQKRGPDKTYIFESLGFIAGMNRLSINDMEHGEQPFLSEDSNVVVFFNGEIYNYPQLKKELKQKGYKFKGHCDGEVLPYLYREHGVNCFAYLNGMFGIIIYDKMRQKIILARDGMGEKPLYYTILNGKFAFSTLIQPLKQCFKNLNLNSSALWDFFTFGFIPEPQTIYEEIKAIPKGSYLEFDCQNGQYQITDFYQQTLEHFSIKDLHLMSMQDLVTQTKEIVMRSVEERLLSDVGVGAFLSGGLDSSIVATLAKQKNIELETFNIAFLDNYDPYCGFANESSFAKLVANKISSKHYEIQVDSKTYQRDLDSFIDAMDQPYGAVSGIGIKMIAKKARELGVKVLLSGDGADEHFGGYSWYPKLQFNNPQFITEQKPKGWHYYAFESEKNTFLNREFFKNLDSRKYFPKRDSKPLAFIDFDRDFYLPFEMMVKLDRMCMSESVEGRAIFVSPEIVSFVKNLNYESLLKGGEKWLLKEAFKDILPLEILKREKHGFNPPIDFWMKNDWLPLLDSALENASLLNTCGILNANMKENIKNLLFSSDRRVGNIAFFIVVLEFWLRRVHG